ncbi:MAG: hypothetical protein HYX86_03745 [Chloroflexi bacterium]|nr:hypothetical protein [Chloroflexota bacterium]
MTTVSGSRTFNYTGSAKEGTTIVYGKSWSIRVSADQYTALLKSFDLKTVDIGTSRDNRPKGSLGEWLGLNVSPVAIASYVGPILIHEGYAEKADRSEIRFLGKL